MNSASGGCLNKKTKSCLEFCYCSVVHFKTKAFILKKSFFIFDPDQMRWRVTKSKNWICVFFPPFQDPPCCCRRVFSSFSVGVSPGKPPQRARSSKTSTLFATVTLHPSTSRSPGGQEWSAALKISISGSFTPILLKWERGH